MGMLKEIGAVLSCETISVLVRTGRRRFSGTFSHGHDPLRAKATDQERQTKRGKVPVGLMTR